MAERSTKKKAPKKGVPAKPVVSPFAEPAIAGQNLPPVKSAAKTSPVKKVTKKARPAASVAASITAAEAKQAASAKPAQPNKRTTKPRAVKLKQIELDPFAALAGDSAVSSPSMKAKSRPVRKKTPPKTVDLPLPIATPAETPVFRALADVNLPPLVREDRARLLMQSPTRAFLYWSLRENPWKRLRDVFGDTQSYTLVLKVTDLTVASATMHQVEAQGDRWFDVEPGHRYEAEIGFYAPNRPYFRVVYSNTIETPRRAPSPRPASDAQWTVSATKFAEVLDASGFSRDAFEVAMAGDDAASAESASHLAFSKMLGGGNFSTLPAEEIRHAMLALAAGVPLSGAQARISPAVYAAIRSAGESVTPERSQAALREFFDIEENEWADEEFGPAVYGTSSVQFPKSLKTRRATAYSPRYNPVSSHSIG